MSIAAPTIAQLEEYKRQAWETYLNSSTRMGPQRWIEYLDADDCLRKAKAAQLEETDA